MSASPLPKGGASVSSNFTRYTSDIRQNRSCSRSLYSSQAARQTDSAAAAAVATTYHGTTPPPFLLSRHLTHPALPPSLPPSACSQWAGGSWLEGEREGDTLKADLPDRNKSNDQQRERFTRCLQVLSCPLILELELCPGLGSN